MTCYYLKLINFEGKLLGEHKELIINPYYGLKKYSIRNKKDGYTYFCSKICYNIEYKNDFILNFNEIYYDENNEEIKQYFTINFDFNLNKYILTRLHKNIKIFGKLKTGENFCIDKKYYFKVGEKYFIIKNILIKINL